MSLRRFRYFVAVASELHVGRAAEGLGIAQPALSQQLRILEDELGVRLLRRVGRGIALTEAGAAFLPEANAAIAQSERAIGVARRTARGELGTINIGYVNTAMLEADLPGLLFAFRASAPDARISLDEIAVQEQITALEQHRWISASFVRRPVRCRTTCAFAASREAGCLPSCRHSLPHDCGSPSVCGIWRMSPSSHSAIWTASVWRIMSRHFACGPASRPGWTCG